LNDFSLMLKYHERTQPQRGSAVNGYEYYAERDSTLELAADSSYNISSSNNITILLLSTRGGMALWSADEGLNESCPSRCKFTSDLKLGTVGFV
jgi:hypothetical protein